MSSAQLGWYHFERSSDQPGLQAPLPVRGGDGFYNVAVARYAIPPFNNRQPSLLGQQTERDPREPLFDFAPGPGDPRQDEWLVRDDWDARGWDLATQRPCFIPQGLQRGTYEDPTPSCELIPGGLASPGLHPANAQHLHFLRQLTDWTIIDPAQRRNLEDLYARLTAPAIHEDGMSTEQLNDLRRYITGMLPAFLYSARMACVGCSAAGRFCVHASIGNPKWNGSIFTLELRCEWCRLDNTPCRSYIADPYQMRSIRPVTLTTPPPGVYRIAANFLPGRPPTVLPPSMIDGSSITLLEDESGRPLATDFSRDAGAPRPGPPQGGPAANLSAFVSPPSSASQGQSSSSNAGMGAPKTPGQGNGDDLGKRKTRDGETDGESPAAKHRNPRSDVANGMSSATQQASSREPAAGTHNDRQGGLASGNGSRDSAESHAQPRLSAAAAPRRQSVTEFSTQHPLGPTARQVDAEQGGKGPEGSAMPGTPAKAGEKQPPRPAKPKRLTASALRLRDAAANFSSLTTDEAASHGRWYPFQRLLSWFMVSRIGGLDRFAAVPDPFTGNRVMNRAEPQRLKCFVPAFIRLDPAQNHRFRTIESFFRSGLIWYDHEREYPIDVTEALLQRLSLAGEILPGNGSSDRRIQVISQIITADTPPLQPTTTLAEAILGIVSVRGDPLPFSIHATGNPEEGPIIRVYVTPTNPALLPIVADAYKQVIVFVLQYRDVALGRPGGGTAERIARARCFVQPGVIRTLQLPSRIPLWIAVLQHFVASARHQNPIRALTSVDVGRTFTFDPTDDRWLVQLRKGQRALVFGGLTNEDLSDMQRAAGVWGTSRGE